MSTYILIVSKNSGGYECAILSLSLISNIVNLTWIYFSFASNFQHTLACHTHVHYDRESTSSYTQGPQPDWKRSKEKHRRWSPFLGSACRYLLYFVNTYYWLFYIYSCTEKHRIVFYEVNLGGIGVCWFTFQTSVARKQMMLEKILTCIANITSGWARFS